MSQEHVKAVSVTQRLREESMLVRGLKSFIMTMAFIFFVLIVGFAILSILQNKFGGNFIGNAAGWVASHASDQ